MALFFTLMFLPLNSSDMALIKPKDVAAKVRVRVRVRVRVKVGLTLNFMCEKLILTPSHNPTPHTHHAHCRNP